MSTKIYNGYRVHVGTENPLTRAMELMNEIRTYMRSAVEHSLLQAIVREAVEIYDQRTLRSHNILPTHSAAKEDKEAAFYVAFRKYLDDPGMMNGREPGEEFTLTVHHHASDPENLYLIAFGQTDVFEEEFLSRDDFFDFSYWDNSDRPEEISEEEWNHRDVMWDKLGVYDNPPAVSGLSLKIRSKYDSPNLWFLTRDSDHPIYNQQIAASLIPTLKERSLKLSVDVLHQRKIQEASGEDNNIWDLLHDAVDAIRDRTPQGVAVIEEVSSTLKEQVTLEDLAAKPEEA